METTKKTQVVGIKNAGIVIICCLVIAVCIFQFLLGNPSNFMNNDPKDVYKRQVFARNPLMIKNMFYNIIIFQRFSRFFQKNFEKRV